MIDSVVDYLLVLFYIDGWIKDAIPRNVMMSLIVVSHGRGNHVHLSCVCVCINKVLQM